MAYRFTGSETTEQNSLRGRVYNHILEGILSGKYKAGEALVEMRLAEETGVSRTPVREAIRQLELEGLVTFIPNKGVFVNGISESDVEDIYTVRALIEGLAVRWAAERLNEDQRCELEETAELMDFYTRKNDMEQTARLDARFHSLIYESCKSKVLKHTLSTLMRYVQQARLGSLKVPERAQRALAEHKAILNALLEGNGTEAEKLMSEHINNALANLIEERNQKK